LGKLRFFASGLQRRNRRLDTGDEAIEAVPNHSSVFRVLRKVDVNEKHDAPTANAILDGRESAKHIRCEQADVKEFLPERRHALPNSVIHLNCV